MKLKIVMLGATLLCAVAVWAQNPAPQASAAAPSASAAPAQVLAPPMARMPLARRNVRNTRMRTPETLFEQRLQEMQDTLAQMHAVLNQMQSKAGKKDQVALDNIRLWELMVGHLDRTLLEARQTAIQRSAMYQNPMAAGAGAPHDIPPPAPSK